MDELKGRMLGTSHVRCEVGGKPALSSKAYLSQNIFKLGTTLLFDCSEMRQLERLDFYAFQEAYRSSRGTRPPKTEISSIIEQILCIKTLGMLELWNIKFILDFSEKALLSHSIAFFDAMKLGESFIP